MGFPVPADEQQRLEDLRKLNILDTLSEEAYDRITKLAVEFFDMPIALITLVDEERQWFKSKVGLELESTSRDVAFCAHTIMEDKPLIVNDAKKDARFKDNPLVLEDPQIRFYAGSPIKSEDDHLLGSVCVIDHVPRDINDNEVRMLETLSEQVSTLLKIRRISQELRRVKQEKRELQKLIPMCSWCKNIRDDDDFWLNVEEYIMAHPDTEITHAICPDCSEKLNEDLHLV